MDWNRLESMLRSYGLDNLAAEARTYGRQSTLEQEMDRYALATQQRQVQELLKRARNEQQKQRRTEPAIQAQRKSAFERAVPVRFRDLPLGAQDFVDALVRQAEPGVIYTLDEQTSRGVPYHCSASFYEETVDGTRERFVFVLVDSERTAGKSTAAYRRQGASWRRLDN